MGGLKPAVVERGPYYVQNSSLQILRTAACLLGCLVMTAHATSSDCVKGFVPTQYSRPAYLACMAAPNLNGKPIGAGAMNVMGASNGVGGIQLNGKPNGCSRQHLKEHNPTNGIPDGGIVIGACMPKSESHCLAQEAAKLGIHASSEERRSPLRSYSTGSLKKGDTPLTRLPRTSTSFFKKQFNSELQAIPSNDVSSNIPDHLDGRTEFIAECKLPTEKGAFMLRSYR